MATVYRGRHMTLGRDVAIKVLHPHLSSTERNRQRFAREARAIEHMDHENILKIFDYSGSETDSCYIVTEYVDGVTLQDLITDRGQLPSEVTAIIGMRLSEALSYAHGLNIIHRDLKPENVMLRRDGTIKLMDFGIAHFLDEMHLTLTGALVGSPAYMSPEQAMERTLDQRSDLFSLGTLLFHLVTGQLPFSGSNPSIILRNIIDGNRPHVMELVPDISGSVAALIEHLLQSDPDDRPLSADAVHAALSESLTSVSIPPDDPRWSLRDWMVDPEGYEARLTEHLKVALLESGRALLEERDHLGALRRFNRLLSIDEDNEEVLSLIQSMHHLQVDDHSAPPVRRWWVAALAVPVAAGVLTWLLWPAPPPPVPQAEAPEVVQHETPQRQEPAEMPAAVEAPIEPEEVLAVEPERRSPLSTEKTVAIHHPITTPKPVVVLQSPDPPPEASPPARVTVIVPGAWADIYLDNRRMGRTGEIDAIEVSPGTHTLRVENDYSLPHTQEITVEAGEVRTITISSLRRKPATVHLPGRDGSCEVILDGISKGTAAGLGYRFQLPEPDQSHSIDLICPEGQTSHTLSGVQPGSTVALEP